MIRQQPRWKFPGVCFCPVWFVNTHYFWYNAVMDDCIFCKIMRGEIPSHTIWEDGDFFAFLDIHPVNPGHVLLIPKRHVDYLFGMEDGEYRELMMRAKMLSGPLLKAAAAKKIGLAVEGIAIRHAHAHLIPLHNGNDIDPHRAQNAPQEELAAMAENIKKFIP